MIGGEEFVSLFCVLAALKFDLAHHFPNSASKRARIGEEGASAQSDSSSDDSSSEEADDQGLQYWPNVFATWPSSAELPPLDRAIAALERAVTDHPHWFVCMFVIMWLLAN